MVEIENAEWFGNEAINNIKQETPRIESDREKKEKQIVDFVENNAVKGILKKHKKTVVKTDSLRFFKVMSILFFILYVAVIGSLFYLGYTGKVDSLIKPMFNNTVTINPPQVDVPITNNYDNKFNPQNTYQNNFTINVYPNIYAFQNCS